MDDVTLQGRAIVAEQLVAAKINEFVPHPAAIDRSAAERTRREAIATMEVDLAAARKRTST